MHFPAASASALFLDDLVGAGELYNAPPECSHPLAIAFASSRNKLTRECVISARRSLSNV
jgi:hypothetical protein